MDSFDRYFIAHCCGPYDNNFILRDGND